MSIDLFALSSECGCAAKLPPGELARMVRDLRIAPHPQVLVGPQTLDDAGVYQLSKTHCLVQTVDFFPPPARDPYIYGQVAAANSLSDVYAMGGRPLTALAVVCYPAKARDPSVLQEMTRGALEKLTEAQTTLLGGHSIVDAQPKYGFCVTGSVDPAQIVDNAHAQAGDLLVLTKPLGTGILIKAAKVGKASREQEDETNRCMATLNREAAALAREAGARSCTDVTGFGLLGHALQMARASRVSMEIEFEKIPMLTGALGLAAMDMVPGPTRTNRDYVASAVRFAESVSPTEQDLLHDPQTSGGLLISCPEQSADELLAKAKANLKTPVAVVGRVCPVEGTQGPTITVS